MPLLRVLRAYFARASSLFVLFYFVNHVGRDVVDVTYDLKSSIKPEIVIGGMTYMLCAATSIHPSELEQNGVFLASE